VPAFLRDGRWGIAAPGAEEVRWLDPVDSAGTVDALVPDRAGSVDPVGTVGSLVLMGPVGATGSAGTVGSVGELGPPGPFGLITIGLRGIR